MKQNIQLKVTQNVLQIELNDAKKEKQIYIMCGKKKLSEFEINIE